MWHKMSVIGKVLLFTTGFGLGMACMAIHLKSDAGKNEGNAINVEVSGKVKRDGTVNINLEDLDQGQEKKGRRKRFLGVF